MESEYARTAKDNHLAGMFPAYGELLLNSAISQRPFRNNGVQVPLAASAPHAKHAIPAAGGPDRAQR